MSYLYDKFVMKLTLPSLTFDTIIDQKYYMFPHLLPQIQIFFHSTFYAQLTSSVILLGCSKFRRYSCLSLPHSKMLINSLSFQLLLIQKKQA